MGAWDLMGDLAPGLHTLGWHKLKLGWLTATEWACVGAETAEAVVTPTSVPGGVKLVATATSPSVAYAAEVRTPVGLDAGMCDPGGVLVYRVDATVANVAGPVVVQPDQIGADPFCGPLAYAPFDVGDSFSAAGVTVQVLAAEGGGFRIRMTSPGRPEPGGGGGGGGGGSTGGGSTGGGSTGGGDTGGGAAGGDSGGTGGDAAGGGVVDETRCVVPRIDRGTKLGAVKRELTSADCSAGAVTRAHSKRVKRGKLIKLKPKPGTVLAAGAAVDIVVSSGPR